MKIAIAQINPVIGAFDENFGLIQEYYLKAVQNKARICVFPELAICGYPLHDLIERPEIFTQTDSILKKCEALTEKSSCALVVGHVARNESRDGRAAFNRVSVFEGGKCVFSQDKSLLPTYDVFDEARYFEPSLQTKIWKCDGKNIGIAICEDLWKNDPSFARNLYGEHDPLKVFQKEKVDLLISVSASPFEMGKFKRREKIHQDISQTLGAPVVYVNQVGANDDILFDGGSFVCKANQEVLRRLPFFEASFECVDLQNDSAKTFKLPEQYELVAQGLVLGIKDYFRKTGHKKAIIGLSGGIDSAVVCTLAVRALGAQNVLGIAMPSQHSSSHSLEDADLLAQNLGIGFEVKPIKFFNSVILMDLEKSAGSLIDLAKENLQARLRGLVLMTLANQKSALVMTTGNKSELAMGYCTLYGDMVGAVDPIGDLFKTQVYALSHWINENWGAPIPKRSIEKAPSAELKPNQKDQDTLAPYEVLDAMLEEYTVGRESLSELEKKYDKQYQSGWVKRMIQMLEMNEYKRRQSAIVLKVSPKAFGVGRRIPVAKRWNS